MRGDFRVPKARIVLPGAALVVAGAITSVALGLQLADAPSSSRVEIRDEGPSGQEGPVEVILPNYPDPGDIGEPTIVGPFRIIPYGYDESRLAPRDPSETEGVYQVAGVTDEDELRMSGLMARIGYLPNEYSLERFFGSLTKDGEVIEMWWQIQGPQAAVIDVTRGLRPLPIDIFAPPEDSYLELVHGDVNGNPAAFLSLKPGEVGPQSITFVDESTGIATVVTGNGSMTELLRLAESIEGVAK